MRIRLAESPTEGIDLTDRPDELFEREIDRTERVINRFREEHSSLLRNVHREVEKMREAVPPSAEPAGHSRRSHDRVEHRFEEHLEALIASLPGRVADLVAAELAGPNVRAALVKLVDLRLQAVTEAIARINGDPKPTKENRRRRSRRFR